MAKKHVHKYHKIEIANGKVWACALEDCSHFMPKYLENTVIGKASICWKCETQFKLTPSNMKDDMPKCADCNPTAEAMGEFLSGLNFGVK